jgi:hypothetical protein
MFTQTLKEGLSIAGTPVHGISASGNQATGTIDMGKFNRAMFVGDIGTLGANATVSAWLEQCVNANGTGNANITGANITAISSANKMFTIEIRADQLAATGTGQYVRCVVNANVASVVSVVPIGAEARYQPSTSNDDASVVQRIVV